MTSDLPTGSHASKSERMRHSTSSNDDDQIQPTPSPEQHSRPSAAPAEGHVLPAKKSASFSSAELQIPRQFSEANTRISDFMNRKDAKSSKKPAELSELKRELEMWEHKVSVDEICKRLDTDPKHGLTTAAAKIRLERDGPNILHPPHSTPWWVKLGLQFLNFFAILLQVASLLCFVGYALDRSSNTNLFLGIILLLVVVVTAVFSFLQDFKADKLMEKLQNFLPPKATVFRNGLSFVVDASELVVGDIIEVMHGDKLPADIRIIVNDKLKVDNSSLTGESEPIGRTVNSTDDNPLETKNLAFFGTLAVDGSAIGVVVNTGDDTVFGRIANLAARASSEETTLQADIRHFVVFISTISICIGAITFIINVVDKVAWITNLVFAIGIIVAQVPEGLLATVTVSLSLSAKRMALKNVLVKKLEAVETLGSTTAICSDKTGTLTQNRMTVVNIGYALRLESAGTVFSHASFDESNACFRVLYFIAACCGKAVFDFSELEHNPDLPIDERKVNGDASEAAILKFAEKIQSVSQFREDNPQVMVIPFNSLNKFMITVNKISNSDGQLRMCMKGAPERVVDRCTHILTDDGPRLLDAGTKATIQEQLSLVMGRGERVLGFAMLDLDKRFFPENFDFNTDEPNFPMEGLTFVGIMSMLDPPKEGVPEAVSLCQAAGIKVIMVTGDHPATAKAIAKKVNIIRGPTKEDVALEKGIPVNEVDVSDIKAIVVPGSQVTDLTEDDWNRILRHDQIVFARTSPQQKLIIVENNQRLGHVVAVTGDGVNDSPALKKANIGIAMGISGSDVSKEAADLVLLDDNFASIVKGIEEGRLIFDNLKKSIAYTLVAKLPEIAPFLAFVIAKIPQAMSVVLILSIDIGCDMLPAIALAFESPESDIMLRKPRNARVNRLVNKRLVSFSYLQIGVFQVLAGFLAFLIVLQDFGWGARGLPGLDGSGYLSATNSDSKRWLFTEQERDHGVSSKITWFSNTNAVYPFGKYFSGTLPGFIRQKQQVYGEVQPSGTGVDQFSNMVKIIGVETGRPPCVRFSCSFPAADSGTSPSRFSVNNRECFTNVSNSLNVTITVSDFLGNVPNPNVIEGLGKGQGCFSLWSVPQQDAVVQNGQTAFFVAVIVCQIACVIACRTRVISMFSHSMLSNRVLVLGVFQELALVIILAYVPPISRAFNTRPIAFVHWLPGMPFAILTLVYDELRKLYIRRADSRPSKFNTWVRDNTLW